MNKRIFIIRAWVIILPLTIFISGCCINVTDIFKAKYTRTYQDHVHANNANKCKIENNIGSIIITGSDVDEFEINAEITVKAQSKEKARKFAEQVAIETELSEDNTILIKVDKPEDLAERNLSIKLNVTAPRKIDLYCSIHVGNIKIANIQGQIRASSEVGSITCENVTNDVELHTNVGSIDVTYTSDASETFQASVTTNVGSINFTAPQELSAKIDASTNIGSITTAKPLTVVGKIGKSVKGTIGSGQGKIHLTTNVGSITIK
jgi:hypothetical protein